jgi:type III secretion protein N (ATPase)
MKRSRPNPVHQFPVLPKTDDLSARAASGIQKLSTFRIEARIERIMGLIIDAVMPECVIGELVEITDISGNNAVMAEVVGFDQQFVKLAALEDIKGLSNQARIRPIASSHKLQVGEFLCGKVLDGYGRAYGTDSFLVPPEGAAFTTVAVMENALSAQDRPPISEQLFTQIRVIDGLLSFGVGQRVGIFAPAGCGKTTLLASIARQVQADVIVISLVGERGRELNEFLESEMTPELRQRSVMVCATSDKTSVERARCAYTASAVAQALAAQGLHVVLMVDSLTRVARALRELGLALGEAPGRGGYPASVFSELPRLIERAGLSRAGSVSGIYTVLMEDGEGQSDLVSEESRSLLDGHIVLSRKLSEIGHFPAVAVVESLSRVMSQVVSSSVSQAAYRFRRRMSALNDVEFLLKLNEYQAGADQLTDEALRKKDSLMAFLKQTAREPSPWQATQAALNQLD